MINLNKQVCIWKNLHRPLERKARMQITNNAINPRASNVLQSGLETELDHFIGWLVREQLWRWI